MPFTPSHAVVALPFIRTPLVPAAIAIGAMAPDLPLFVRGMPLHYGRTHDLLWLPATVLLALVLLLVWRCVLRPAVRELSPAWLAARLPAPWDAGALDSLRDTFGTAAAPEADGLAARRVSWRGVTLLTVSLIIGVLSHILWDMFTHEGRWGVEAIPALEEQWGVLDGYKWLQHGSSALGLAIIATWAVTVLVRAEPAPVDDRLLPPALRVAWWASLPVFLLVGWVWGLAVFGPLDPWFTAVHLAYRVLPQTCGIWGAATLVLCVIIQMRRARRTAPAVDPAR